MATTTMPTFALPFPKVYTIESHRKPTKATAPLLFWESLTKITVRYVYKCVCVCFKNGNCLYWGNVLRVTVCPFD